jgi:hypothetical protein
LVALKSANACWQDAAKSAGDAEAELRCRLAVLAQLLPPPPALPLDEAAHCAPACGPPPAALSELSRPVKAAVLQVCAPFAAAQLSMYHCAAQGQVVRHCFQSC